MARKPVALGLLRLPAAPSRAGPAQPASGFIICNLARAKAGA